MLLRGILLLTFLVIVASFVLATVESQMVSVYPPSVTTQSGEENIRLSCNVTGLPPNAYIEWIYYPTWFVSGITIYSTYDGINNDPTNFTVLPMTTVGDTHSLDLVINTVHPLLAAQYLCDVTHKLSQGKSIHVFVLDPMECPGGIVECDEGKEVNLSCSVNYYDSTQTYDPRITWKRYVHSVLEVVHISESSTRRTARLTKNVTSADDNKKFVCVVDFLGSNLTYRDDCSTVVHVRHASNEISFYPPSVADAPTVVRVGDVIDCKANGRPAPTIEWYDNNGTLLSELRKVRVTEEMLSWEQPITLHCRANNTIDNGMTFRGVEGNYTFNVVEAPRVEACYRTARWVFAMIVIVPIIVVLVAIAIAVFFIIRHRKKKTKYTEKTTKDVSDSALLSNY